MSWDRTKCPECKGVGYVFYHDGYHDDEFVAPKACRTCRREESKKSEREEDE